MENIRLWFWFVVFLGFCDGVGAGGKQVGREVQVWDGILIHKDT